MPRMIIVDDEERVRETLGVYGEILGYEPILVKELNACPVYRFNHECDKDQPCAEILLVDQFLTTMFGLDLIERQVKKGCKTPAHCKAILAGAFADDEFMRAKNLGCHVLMKPVTCDSLENWITSLESKIQ